MAYEVQYLLMSYEKADVEPQLYEGLPYALQLLGFGHFQRERLVVLFSATEFLPKVPG